MATLSPATDDLAPLKQSLGDLLAAHRADAGLTQQQLADNIGYSRVTVATAESGHRQPAESFWDRCDHALGAEGELSRAYRQLATARHDRKQEAARRQQSLRDARVAERRVRVGAAPLIDVEQHTEASISRMPSGSLPSLMGGFTSAPETGPGPFRSPTPSSPVPGAAPVAPTLRRLAPGDDPGEAWRSPIPGGRFFDGSSIDVVTCRATDDAQVVAAAPDGLADARLLRGSARGLLLCVVETEAGDSLYGLDTRTVRRRLARAPAGTRLAVPRAYAVDDLTLGLIWAVANLDESLLGDDALLAGHRQRLAGYESFTRSAVSRDDAEGLSAVSRMWLGSDFCARHIARHAEGFAEAPAFWTRERNGEEASSWLLFSHKVDYLRRLAERFGSAGPSRTFCVPTDAVEGSPRFERVLLLLAAALMESFGVRVEVCADLAYTGVEGFVLDPRRRAIVANWVGADGIWHVDVTDRLPALRDYSDINADARARSVIAAPTASGRIRAFADYLDLPWGWLTRRCAQLGEYGLAGFAEPRSRLLSVAGVDRACRYIGELDPAANPYAAAVS